MKEKTVFICSNCNNQQSKWMGRCPECNNWNTFEEVVINRKSAVRQKRIPAVKLDGVKTGAQDRIVTSVNEFNRVMGGGIIRDSITIIASRPGGGKSTLVLEIANDVAQKGSRVLYASGEESESQIKSRADRILPVISENLWILSDNSMDNVLESVDETDPDLIIIDSIQTFTLDGFPGSRAGSPVQTMECAAGLVALGKNRERKRAVIMVGQMTKEDELAGLRALEHLVDTVLYIESEDNDELRTLLATKNRFGSTGEMGFFSMTERGMVSIDNPSEYFMTHRDDNDRVTGSALTVVREGTRPIIAEVESLVTKSFTPFPARISESVKREQLNTLISILEQRGKVLLYDKDVVVKTTGGLRFKEQAVNLAVIISIVSSVYDRPVPGDSVFIADVGLTGELKIVPSSESRIRELGRMGFKRVYVAQNTPQTIKVNEKIKIVRHKTLKDVLNDVFQGD